jgi:hypothetical protein
VTDHVDKVTAPWKKVGETIEGTEAEFARVSDEIGRLDKLVSAGHSEWRLELDGLNVERSRLSTLLANVREPEVPYTQGLRHAAREAADIAAVERALVKVDAQGRLDQLADIDAEIGAWNTIGDVSAVVTRTVRKAPAEKVAVKGGGTIDEQFAAAKAARAEQSTLNKMRPAEVQTTVRKVTPLQMIRQNREGKWTWVGAVPPVPDALYAKIMEFLDHYSGPKGNALARNSAEAGDIEIWQAIAKVRDSAPFRKLLTNSQKQMVDRVTSRPITSSLDEYKSAWDQTGAASEDDFLKYLVSRRVARDDILEGTSEWAIGRSANRASGPGTSIPEWAIEEAKKGKPSRVWRDPAADVASRSARQSLARALDGGEETLHAVPDIIRQDPHLLAEAESIATRTGATLDELLYDPGAAPYLREMVKNLDETPIIPGAPKAASAVDEAILANSADDLDLLADELANARGALDEPLHDVPREAAEALARVRRPSAALADDMAAAEVSWNDVIDAEMWAKYDVAARGSSYILHGKLGFPPRTPRALLTVLREIENGNAARGKIGDEMAAEVQRAATRILGHLIGDARKAQFDRGVIGMGPYLNPYTWTAREAEMWTALVGKHGQKAGLTVREGQLGIQYGLKQLPDNALALEMSTVPGLAEEMLAGGFKTWNQRVGTAHVRQAYNLIFGKRRNQEVFYEARGRFIDALAKQGVDAKLATAVWSEWKRVSADTKTVLGRIYASERNIPDKLLNTFARDEVERFFKDYPSSAVTEAAKAVDFAEEFRKATSFTRRLLADERVPFGDRLQQAYGFVAHNAFVTFYYPLFRFQIDLRYQGLNWMEGRQLYWGRSKLRRDPGKLIEGDQGMFDGTRENFAHVAEDGLNDTGYPFSRPRVEWTYRSMLKEQPDALRGLMAEDPALFEDVIKRIAELDPELAVTIKAMGHTPDEYLRVMDRYYKKVLSSADPEAAIKKEVMQDAMGDPTLAEVYGRIADVNAKLMADARAVFFGNPARSNIERVLNSYLLYWPISYQIKASKWLFNIMFDRIGGLQTNSAGAYGMNELQKAHQDLVKSDPVYREYIDEHPTLLFAAQMLFPMTPFSLGVSLSPLTRDLFFGTSKGIMEIGPIYTISKLLPQVRGELYKDFHDVPGVDPIARLLGEPSRKP